MRLLEAAEAAGVCHFLPSEYAIDLPLLQRGSTLDALAVRQAVIDSGLDYTFVVTGGFTG